VACHFQGGVGGGGDSKHNVHAFEVHPAPGRPEVAGGVLHNFAVTRDCRESHNGLHNFFAIIPGGLKIVGGCQIITREFDPVRVDSVNTTALFGAGYIDRISGKSILYESGRKSFGAIGKELLGNLNGISPGRPRILADGRVGKFGWKAQFATLEEFVAAACANELGLGNPMMEQAKPWTRAVYTKVEPDLSKHQFRSLVAFVDTLARPTEIVPIDPAERRLVERGKRLFEQVGCAVCHTPEIGGVAGIYSDFLLHRITGEGIEGGRYTEEPSTPLPDGHPLQDEWKTPPLWGVADSAPYFHDGGSPTLAAAILRHRGTAASVTKAFEALTAPDRDAIVGFLKSLRAPSEAKPTDPHGQRMIAMAR
jgi:CxxC motif-containing protein (DUF1111 family)